MAHDYHRNGIPKSDTAAQEASVIFNPFADQAPTPKAVEPHSEAPVVGEPTPGKEKSVTPQRKSARPAQDKKGDSKPSKKVVHSDNPAEDKIIVYCTFAQKKQIQRSCLELGIKAAQLGRATMLDYLNNTYFCKNGNCGAKFTVGTPEYMDGGAPKATRCPVCGGAVTKAEFL